MAKVQTRRKLKVYDIGKSYCRELVLNHHYSGRVPGIKYCWGLLEKRKIVGCIIYSIPASYTLCKGVCGPEFKDYVLELSRLVIFTKTRNAASFLIGNSLKMLPNSIVVSYADCNDHVGHVGYVYQATNWIYTGHASAEPIWINPRNGEIVSYTRRHIDKKAEAIGLDWVELERRKQLGKHRYVTFAGAKKFKQEARKAFRYKQQDYPKGETKRHQICIMPEQQKTPRQVRRSRK